MKTCGGKSDAHQVKNGLINDSKSTIDFHADRKIVEQYQGAKGDNYVLWLSRKRILKTNYMRMAPAM